MVVDKIEEKDLKLGCDAGKKYQELKKIRTMQIIIYGYGTIGIGTETLCENLGLKICAVCDLNKEGERCKNGVVESVESAVARLKDVVIIVCVRGCFDEVKQMYKHLIPEDNFVDGDEFYHNNPSFFVLAEDNPYKKEILCYKELYEKNSGELQYILSHLSDQKSVDTVINRFKYIYTRNKEYWEGLYDPCQYFSQDLVKMGTDEVFIDCGAYDGDTLMQFMGKTNGMFRKAYCMEPGKLARARLEELIKKEKLDEKVVIYPYGAFDKKGKVYFSESGTASRITNEAEGMNSINTVTIDELNIENVTFIKMDIEGSELAALKGAEKTIKKNRPNLAICIYHKPEDIIDIPLYIMGLGIDYKYYVRQHYLGATETVFYAIR